MPINTYTCDECGARNNYIVDLDRDGNQSVECVRCGSEKTIGYYDLPDRTRDTISELNDINRKFTEDMSYFEQDSQIDEDTVESAIKEVDGAFKRAKQELQVFDETLNIDTNIENIADQYAPREEEMTDFMKAVKEAKSATTTEDGHLRENWKSSAAKEAVKSYSKTKLSQRWDASDEEIDSIFNVVEQIAVESKNSGLSIRELLTKNPRKIIKIITGNVDANLAKQLIGMVDKGNFVELLTDAVDDYHQVSNN